MADSLNLSTEDGTRLNAKLDLHPLGIILHSRSGTTRNRDYRLALELLLSRLDAAKIAYEIYLDSGPVQDIPLDSRRLTFNRAAPISKRFDELVRVMNAGSSSHGAWRRLLIATPNTDHANLQDAIRSTPAEQAIDRLPASELRKVKRSHIHRAVLRLLNGEDAVHFAPSRDYDALTDGGVPLAPKKVFGLALEEALGIVAHPGHFSAGWGQICFELLEEAGLWIVPKSGAVARPKANQSKIELELATFVPTEEEKCWIEGNPKIVSHLKRERQPGLSKQKRAEFIAQHGRLFCEQCGLDPMKVYGEQAGAACIEVHHHQVHVADMLPGYKSKTSDLMCLCASCHRVLHRKLALGLTAPA